MAGAVPSPGGGGADRCPPGGPAPNVGPPRDRGRDVEAAAQETRCHALVLPAAGRQAGHRKRLGRAGLAGLRGQTVSGKAMWLFRIRRHDDVRTDDMSPAYTEIV